ncbi:MAG: hypothetical protein QXP77_02075 [Candidatus Aenigmatarchaeota archaeon]
MAKSEFAEIRDKILLKLLEYDKGIEYSMLRDQFSENNNFLNGMFF